MRSLPTSCVLAGLCFTTQILAQQQPQATSFTSTGSRLDDLIPSATPFPHFPPNPSRPNLELRQNLGVDPDVASAIPGQVPPVTVYSIVSQVGATGVDEIYTYTQLFDLPVVQFPAARPGTIGYGSDQKKKKREVEARATGTPNTNTGIAGRIAWRDVLAANRVGYGNGCGIRACPSHDRHAGHRDEGMLHEQPSEHDGTGVEQNYAALAGHGEDVGNAYRADVPTGLANTPTKRRSTVE